MVKFTLNVRNLKKNKLPYQLNRFELKILSTESNFRKKFEL
jgi:hypothetical protein